MKKADKLNKIHLLCPREKNSASQGIFAKGLHAASKTIEELSPEVKRLSALITDGGALTQTNR